MQLNAIVIAVAVTELQAGAAGGHPATVHTEADQQTADLVWAAGQTLVRQVLVQLP